MEPKRIDTFEEFYRHYLKEHQNKYCRLLHMIGTTIVLALFLTCFVHVTLRPLIFMPLCGYGFAWFGHFFFEKNQPATFQYPLWSLKSDFIMYFEILTNKLTLDGSQDPK